MKKILMIATGGTIASIPSDNGLVPGLSGNDIINLVPELKDICNIDVMKIMNIDSSNLSPKHWIMMLDTIEKNYNNYDGFVVTHGTDTMAYSSSMLACAIENLAKPIVFTGSQLPIKAKSTDACRNVHDAFLAACSDNCGVFLAFNGLIHNGDCTKKVYSENFTGFLSINQEIAGTSDNEKIIWNTLNKKPEGEVVFYKDISEKVFVLKMIPSLKPEIIDVLVNMGYRAVIIEGYGAGGVPTEECENNFMTAIQKAIEKGVAIVCATQCLYDGVHLDKYPMGIMAEKYGAISCKNITLEKALVKIMIGLGNNMTIEELKIYIENH